jgi:hypothetical protein
MHALLSVATLAILTTVASPVHAEGKPNCWDNCLQAGGNVVSCATQCRAGSEPQKKAAPSGAPKRLECKRGGRVSYCY